MIVVLWNMALALAWTAITGSFTLGNFMLGFAIGVAALLVTQHVPGVPHYTKRPLYLLALGAYTAIEVTLANLRVAREIVTGDIHPALLSVETDAESDLEITLLAALVTLTPGTTVVDLSPDGKRILVHFTNLPPGGPDAARRSVKEGFERRILRVTR